MIAKKITLFACFNAAPTLTVQLDAVALMLSVKIIARAVKSVQTVARASLNPSTVASSVKMSTLVTIGRFVVVFSRRVEFARNSSAYVVARALVC